MRVPKVEFDETTDYAAIQDVINNKIAELSVYGCGCCTKSELDETLLKLTMYSKAAEENTLRGYTIKYQEVVKASYNLLRKFDC